MRYLLIFPVSIQLMVVAPSFATVKPAPLFTDNLVLQRNAKVPIWGTADPQEKVTVTVGTQAVAGADGRWRLELAPMKATPQPFDVTVAGSNTIGGGVNS